MAGGPTPRPGAPHGRSRSMAATMLLGEFLLLLWLGMTVVGDSAGRSIVVALLLTVITAAGVTWDQRRRRA